MQRPGTWIAADRAGTAHTHYGHTIITYDGGYAEPLFQSWENWYFGPVTINWFVYPFFHEPKYHHYFGPVTINYIGPGTYGATTPGGHHYFFAEPVIINYVEGVAIQPNQPLESRDGRSYEHAPCGYTYSRLPCGAPVPGCIPVFPSGYRALTLFELSYLRQSTQEGGAVEVRLITNSGPGTNGGYTATEDGDHPATENGDHQEINGGHWGIAGGQIWVNGGEQGIDGGHPVMHNGDHYDINYGQHGLNGGQPWTNGGRPGLNGGQPWTNGDQPGLNGGQPGPNGGQLRLNGGQPGLNGGQCGLNGGQPGPNGEPWTNGGQPRISATQLVWGQGSREWYPQGQPMMSGALQAAQADEPGSPAQNGRVMHDAEEMK